MGWYQKCSFSRCLTMSGRDARNVGKVLAGRTRRKVSTLGDQDISMFKSLVFALGPGGVPHRQAGSRCGLPHQTCTGFHVPPPFSGEKNHPIGAPNAYCTHHTVRALFSETERRTWFISEIGYAALETEPGVITCRRRRIIHGTTSETVRCNHRGN